MMVLIITLGHISSFSWSQLLMFHFFEVALCSFWFSSINPSIMGLSAGLFERRIDHGSGATDDGWSVQLWVRLDEKRMANRLRSCTVLMILLVVYFSWVSMCKVWESWEVWSIHLDMVDARPQDHWSPRFQQRGAVLRRLVTNRRLVGAVGCGSCLEPHRCPDCPVSLSRKHQHLHFPEKGHFDYPLYQDSMLAPILEVVGRCSRDGHQCESGFSCLLAPNFHCMVPVHIFNKRMMFPPTEPDAATSCVTYPSLPRVAHHHPLIN